MQGRKGKIELFTLFMQRKRIIFGEEVHHFLTDVKLYPFLKEKRVTAAGFGLRFGFVSENT